jgi:hypothetical protein
MQSLALAVAVGLATGLLGWACAWAIRTSSRARSGLRGGPPLWPFGIVAGVLTFVAFSLAMLARAAVR